MIDLYGNRSNETYTYRRVSWPDFIEGADIGNVTGGSVELSALSDLKATCSFDFEGMEAPDQNDMVRIYYSFTDDYGESAEFCIGTFLIGYSETTNVADYAYDGSTLSCDGLRVSGTADGWSVLKVLQDKALGYAYTVSSGTQPIARAIALMQAEGLRVNSEEESSYTLASDHTFDAGDSLLTVVNWLCTAADYQAPYPDAYGTVQVSKYISPEQRAVVAEFANDDNSIMYPEVVVSNDWQSTPNVVRLSYDTDTLGMWAASKNMSGSKASLSSRGNRELTQYESVTELEGSTSAEMLANLKAMAKSTLLDNSSEIEHVTLSHPYIPIVANDAIRIDYAGTQWSGNVQNVSIDLSPATKCDTEIRRFISNDITTVESGAIIHETEADDD